jgi:hypothetical protein
MSCANKNRGLRGGKNPFSFFLIDTIIDKLFNFFGAVFIILLIGALALILYIGFFVITVIYHSIT